MRQRKFESLFCGSLYKRLTQRLFFFNIGYCLKNYDFIFILICLFVFRIIALSGSFADASCLIALLAYRFGKDYIVIKQVGNDIQIQIDQDRKTTQAQLVLLADEISKVKNVSEGIKAAITFNKK